MSALGKDAVDQAAVALFLQAANIPDGYDRHITGLALDTMHAHLEDDKPNPIPLGSEYTLLKMIELVDKGIPTQRVASLILRAHHSDMLDSVSKLWLEGLFKPLFMAFAITNQFYPGQTKELLSLAKSEILESFVQSRSVRNEEIDHLPACIVSFVMAQRLSPTPDIFYKMLSYITAIPEDKLLLTEIEKSNVLLLPYGVKAEYNEGRVYFERDGCSDKWYSYYYRYFTFEKLETCLDLGNADPDYLKVQALMSKFQKDLKVTRYWKAKNGIPPKLSGTLEDNLRKRPTGTRTYAQIRSSSHSEKNDPARSIRSDIDKDPSRAIGSNQITPSRASTTPKFAHN